MVTASAIVRPPNSPARMIRRGIKCTQFQLAFLPAFSTTSPLQQSCRTAADLCSSHIPSSPRSSNSVSSSSPRSSNSVSSSSPRSSNSVSSFFSSSTISSTSLLLSQLGMTKLLRNTPCTPCSLIFLLFDLRIFLRMTNFFNSFALSLAPLVFLGTATISSSMTMYLSSIKIIPSSLSNLVPVQLTLQSESD
ncbi:hypothetical protein Sjap_002775 [Stephania japonica]|uniref:Uncharacterized protein n=1 Tax=Stephania japonica TaxID=461633 RepID=A0AAP0KQ45_9MAGN